MPKQIIRLSTGAIVGVDDKTGKITKYTEKDVSIKSFSEKEIFELAPLLAGVEKSAIVIQETSCEHRGEN